MDKDQATALAAAIMQQFAAATGLTDGNQPPRRYLWTDAFGVCCFLELNRRTGEERWLELAGKLVQQVHLVLGHRRAEDPEGGWLSGLDGDEARLHPTSGGLRIGKQKRERAPDEPVDERLEWDRDGQYYHYLTKWMHALQCLSRMTGDPEPLRWSMELAKTAHAAFCHRSADGTPALYWKMSTDLTRPQVNSVGQHDPLDGLITFLSLQSGANGFPGEPLPDLSAEIAELSAMCGGREWATDDPLGIGGLLWDMNRIGELTERGEFRDLRLFQQVVDAGLLSMQSLGGSFLDIPPRYRLAFRELGLSIGLKGLARFARNVDEHAELHDREFLEWLQPRLEGLTWHLPLTAKIEHFWLEKRGTGTEHWKEHRDINDVMLATSLVPDQFLRAG